MKNNTRRFFSHSSVFYLSNEKTILKNLLDFLQIFFPSMQYLFIVTITVLVNETTKKPI